MIKRAYRDDLTKEQVLKLVKRGIGIQVAFRMLHFTKAQYQAWLDEDKEFDADVLHASAVYEQSLLLKVDSAADDDWKATVWLLQNHPDLKHNYVPTKTDPVVQVVLLYDRDADQRTFIDVPVVQPLLPSDGYGDG